MREDSVGQNFVRQDSVRQNSGGSRGNGARRGAQARFPRTRLGALSVLPAGALLATGVHVPTAAAPGRAESAAQQGLHQGALPLADAVEDQARSVCSLLDGLRRATGGAAYGKGLGVRLGQPGDEGAADGHEDRDGKGKEEKEKDEGKGKGKGKGKPGKGEGEDGGGERDRDGADKDGARPPNPRNEVGLDLGLSAKKEGNRTSLPGPRDPDHGPSSPAPDGGPPDAGSPVAGSHEGGPQSGSGPSEPPRKKGLLRKVTGLLGLGGRDENAPRRPRSGYSGIEHQGAARDLVRDSMSGGGPGSGSEGPGGGGRGPEQHGPGPHQQGEPGQGEQGQRGEQGQQGEQGPGEHGHGTDDRPGARQGQTPPPDGGPGPGHEDGANHGPNSDHRSDRLDNTRPDHDPRDHNPRDRDRDARDDNTRAHDDDRNPHDHRNPHDPNHPDNSPHKPGDPDDPNHPRKRPPSRLALPLPQLPLDGGMRTLSSLLPLNLRLGPGANSGDRSPWCLPDVSLGLGSGGLGGAQLPERLAVWPAAVRTPLLVLTGLTYRGIREVDTAAGPKRVLAFTAFRLDIADLQQDAALLGAKCPGQRDFEEPRPPDFRGLPGLRLPLLDIGLPGIGRVPQDSPNPYPDCLGTLRTAGEGTTSTATGEPVVLLTQMLSGNLLGLLPVTFTPDMPPPLPPGLTLPIPLFFTDVIAHNQLLQAEDLNIPNLHQSLP
ncbi:hypothetical protein HUT18_07910 [Streptomyces sp. NA04227]|uniref:hypothetical protein n=1 Tax=Streptomyces sp. NA04227 TaxID=2742136 RepID=UPI001590919F|nr:hypothetical protein [Streptomyces sp. NA04227]QKW06340.1 hypothetical protein HUT18_07910 [Streptomyces sp. NA04227]